MPTARHDAASHDYLMTVHRHLSTMLGRRFAPDLADEMTQAECCRLLERIDRVMSAYPDPEVYAKVCARGRLALLRLRRADDVQAGRGARRGRQVDHGEARPRSWHDRPGRPGDTGTLYERYVRRMAIGAEGSDDHLDRLDRLQVVLASLTPREREVLYLVDGQGYTVTEAARRLHIARETAARLRSAARRRIAAIA